MTTNIHGVRVAKRLQINTPYPFALSKLLTDGKSILFTMSDGSIVNAGRTKQMAFKEIIEIFCKKIEFSDSQIAERFYPLGKNSSIVWSIRIINLGNR